MHSQASHRINCSHYEMCYDVRLGTWLGQPPMYSRLQKSCNTQAEQWKTTIDLPRMNLIIFPASACPSSGLVPRPLPDFISQPWRIHGCEIKSGSGLGTRLPFLSVQAQLWFSTVQLACSKTFSICCTCLQVLISCT